MKTALAILFVGCVVSCAQTNTNTVYISFTNSIGDLVTNAIVTGATAEGLIYSIPAGGGFVNFTNLSDNLKQQYGYDPDKAATAAQARADQKAAEQQRLADLQYQQALQASVAQSTANRVQTITDSIHDFAEKKWPNDYEMQKYEIDKQIEAYNWLSSNSSYSGVPQDIYDQIKSSAADKWADDYEMRQYEVKKQSDAYISLHQ